MQARGSLAAVAVLLALLGGAANAQAATPSKQRAVAIARAVPAVQRELARHPGLRPVIGRTPGHLEVRWLHNDEQGVAVTFNRRGEIDHVWSGYQAAWPAARGYRGWIGGVAASWWIWIPLCVAFLLPFADFRRPLSLRNLDLAALVGLSVSFAFFNKGDLGLSVPLVYPPLAYITWRLFALGIRRPPLPRLTPNVPVRRLAYLLPLLVALHVVLIFASPYVLDETGAALAGADRMAHGLDVYGYMAKLHGDTYGPVVYLAYLPFELLWPFHGGFDPLAVSAANPAAAHVASAVFDLLTGAALYSIGRQIGGRALGTIVAYGWFSLPLTLLAPATGASDALVALLVALALATVRRRPAVSGFVTGLGALAKFVPGLLVPLLLVHPSPSASSGRRRVLFAAGLALGLALPMIPVLTHTSLSNFYDRTIGYQANRYSPFAIWGLYDPLARGYADWLLEALVRAGTVAVAVVLAVRPRERTFVQTVALAGGVLVAAQLGASYWMYPYAAWLLVPGLVAFLAPFALCGGGGERLLAGQRDVSSA